MIKEELKDFDIIAQWSDGDDYTVTFLCENFPNCSDDVIKEIFEHKVIDYEFAGFYWGVHPRKYQLLYGLRKADIIKYKLNLYDEAVKDIQEKFEEYAEEFEALMSQKLLEYQDGINNQKLTKWME